MKFFNLITQLYARYQYPVSLPEEIAAALGINASNNINFKEFIKRLTAPTCSPTKLSKYMSRESAEATFESALRKERFPRHSLFSYYFNNGWLGFYLQFDQEARLRRVYIQHKELLDEVEMGLTSLQK